MPIPDEIVRVTVTWGPIPTSTEWPGEEAVTTWHVHHHHNLGNTFDWDTEIAHLPAQLVLKLSDHWPTIGELHDSQFTIREVKCAHLAADGHTLHEGAYLIDNDGLTGLSGAGVLPPEVALCVSSWNYQPGTFATLKGRKRNRFYLPYLSKATCGSDGLVSSSVLATQVAGYQSFMNDVQGMHTFASTDIIDGPDYWDWAIVSKVDGNWFAANYVSIDDHFDSQRRRQRQTAPSRSVLPLTHG